jgi:hypothetical protein
MLWEAAVELWIPNCNELPLSISICETHINTTFVQTQIQAQCTAGHNLMSVMLWRHQLLQQKQQHLIAVIDSAKWDSMSITS